MHVPWFILHRGCMYLIINSVTNYLVGCCMCLSSSYLCVCRTLPWVINSEVFAIETRGSNIIIGHHNVRSNSCQCILYFVLRIAFNVAISCGVFWIFSAATAQVTAVIIDSPLGIAGYLYIVIGCTVASFIVVLFTVPETKVM